MVRALILILLLGGFAAFKRMPFHCFKGFVAQIMLDFAGVGSGGFFTDAQGEKKVGQQTVTLIDSGGNFHAHIRQRNQPIFFHGNVAVFTQPPGGIAYAGLGDFQFGSDIDRANIAMLLFENQHSLQIIFGRF